MKKPNILNILAVLALFLAPATIQARWYSPDNGRFWTMDSYEGHRDQPLTLHKYIYCAADPVNNVDPSGHFFTAIEFGFASSIAVGTRGAGEGARAPTYAGAITAVLVLAAGITAVETLPDILEQVRRNRDRRIPYFRYDRLPGRVSFGPGTDVTSRADLTWSEALAITYHLDVDTLYMYTLLTRPGDVGHHPAGPFVGNVPQFQLVKTVSAPNVIMTRVLRRGDEL